MPSQKKILILTYYWPPSGGAGFQRWLKLSKYLSEKGVEVHVVTVDPDYASFPYIDHSTEAEVSPKIHVYKTKATNYFNWYKRIFRKKKVPHSGTFNTSKNPLINNIVKWVRSNLFIPDPRKGWNKYAYKRALEIISMHSIHTIITSSAPNSTHLIGLRLKSKQQNLKWICDFRDAWTKIDFYKDLNLSKISDLKHKKLEKQVLDAANVILTIGETIAQEFREMTSTPVQVISNGYDHVEYVEKEQKIEDRFSITYTGSINKSRNPTILWRTLKHLCDMNPEFKEDLVVNIYGEVHAEVLASIHENNLWKNVNHTLKIPHNEVAKVQMQSQLLLLIINRVENANHILTSKIFEYFGAQRPIIAIGPKEGDANGLLERTKAGKMFGYEALEELKHYLLFLYTEHKKEDKAIVYHGSDLELQKFTHAHLSKQVIDLLQ